MAKLVSITLQRDIDELLASRRPLAIAGKTSKVVSGFCHVRPRAEAAEPILFLIHAVKRGIRSSADRNKQKRRLRQAVCQLPIYDAITQSLTASGRQALVLLRTAVAPSKAASWETILADMELIGRKLEEMSGHA